MHSVGSPGTPAKLHACRRLGGTSLDYIVRAWLSVYIYSRQFCQSHFVFPPGYQEPAETGEESSVTVQLPLGPPDKAAWVSQPSHVSSNEHLILVISRSTATTRVSIVPHGQIRCKRGYGLPGWRARAIELHVNQTCSYWTSTPPPPPPSPTVGVPSFPLRAQSISTFNFHQVRWDILWDPIKRFTLFMGPIWSFEFEWRFYALSGSKAIFRARTYSHITYSVR